MPKLVLHRMLNVILLVFLFALMGMKSTGTDDLDAWFDDDFEDRALAVNEGELVFLNSAPEKPPHLLKNTMVISSSSLKDGWVKLVQCHDNLDPVGSAQVLYHMRRTRGLKVLSSGKIGRVWVERNSVQMEDINPGASLCIQAEVRALHTNFDGTYSMRNGPFLRKYLDGYYPMRVTMDVDLPADQLSFEAIMPPAQDGFQVTHSANHMKIDALFVGELSVEVYFDDIRTGHM